MVVSLSVSWGVMCQPISCIGPVARQPTGPSTQLVATVLYLNVQIYSWKYLVGHQVKWNSSQAKKAIFTAKTETFKTLYSLIEKFYF